MGQDSGLSGGSITLMGLPLSTCDTYHVGYNSASIGSLNCRSWCNSSVVARHGSNEEHHKGYAMGCHVLPMRNTIIAKSQDESV